MSDLVIRTNVVFQISWGTKETGLEQLDLGTVQATPDNKVVEVELDEAPADRNSSYMDALHRLKIRKPLPTRKGGATPAEKEQAAKDYYASVRTNVSRPLVPCCDMRLMRI